MYVLLLSGGYTASSGAGTSCSGWPLCNGQVIPGGTRFVHIHFFHRFVVLLVTIAFAVLVWAAMRWLRGNRTAQRMVRDSFGLFIVQIFIGALNVWTKLDTPIRVLHLATGAALWTALVLIAWTGYALSRRPSTEPVEQRTAEPLAGGRPARGGRSQEAAG
jgi:heme A synthase